MSVVKIPKPIGTLTVPACPKCGEDHEGAIVFERGEGPCIICRRTVHYVPVGPGPYTPLPDGYEIKEWVPQGSMIGTVADLTCIAGHYKLRIERLEKQLAAPVTPATAAAGVASGEALTPALRLVAEEEISREIGYKSDTPQMSHTLALWFSAYKQGYAAHLPATAAAPAAGLLPGVTVEAQGDPYTLDDVIEYLHKRSANPFLEAALDFLTRKYTATPESPAPGLLAGAWVKCDGVADCQAEEDWAWVCMPDGSVQLATWKEAYWEDESLWEEAIYTIPGHEGEKHLTPRFVWAEYYDEGRLHTLTPQPVHFQPKPAPHPDALPPAPDDAQPK